MPKTARRPIVNAIARTLGSAAHLLALAVLLTPAVGNGASRIKDIADFEGIRDNILIGYGLVVGLNGTGDTLRNAPFTRQSLESMLERLGVNVRGANIKVDNIAAVMVTSDLPPFTRQGSRIDVAVSSLGDAGSLQGGVLLATPLIGANGEVFAVAQGAVAIGGFSASGEGGSVVRGVPTSGHISNGGIVEREIGFELKNLTSIRVALRNPDLSTAWRIADAVNRRFKNRVAEATDPSTVLLTFPAGMSSIVDFLAKVEQIKVEPDQAAKVVISESEGIIVIGQNVRIDPVAVAQGNLTIRVSETPQVSQPGPFAQRGQTTTVPRTDIEIEENDVKLTTLKPGVSLQDLVDGLNALGIGPRDLISILQTVKAAGALQAEIVVR